MPTRPLSGGEPATNGAVVEQDAGVEQDLVAHLWRLTENISTALVRLSLDWTIVYVNSHAESVLGQNRDALIGRSWTPGSRCTSGPTATA